MKKIIFVEDKILKKVIQCLLKNKQKSYSVRIPKEGGGWNNVLQSLADLQTLKKDKGIEILAVGILDGDIKEKAVKIAEEKGINNKIFYTQKREVERYFYDKKEMKKTFPEEVQQMDFNKFKKWINEEVNETHLQEIIHNLLCQNCAELKDIIEFIS